MLRRCGRGSTALCVAGGDGTLNEVITGLMQAETRPVLGYVPAGTTNHFAFSLGISKVPPEAGGFAARAIRCRRWILALPTIAIFKILRVR